MTSWPVAANFGWRPAPGDAADVTFTCNGSTFALLAYGRFTVEEAVAAGDITVEGNRELAAQF